MITEEPEELHRSGAWKVAYADFVTALMALFIVLWLMNSSREVREQISGYFRDPKGHNQLTGSARAGLGEGLAVDRSSVGQLREKLETAMREMPGFSKFSKYVNFSVTSEGLRIELMESDGGMFFETGSPRPTERGDSLFRLIAGQIGALPNQVAIEGHTDARPFRAAGIDTYGNWELSFERANTARRIMLGNGVNPNQIDEIRGYADKRPLQGGDPKDSRNRRVSIVMKYKGD